MNWQKYYSVFTLATHLNGELNQLIFGTVFVVPGAH